MNTGRVATRYARALFEVSLEQSMDNRGYIACQRMIQLWYENPELRFVLSERMVPNSSKVEILELLMNPTENALASRFFEVMAEENRIDIIPNVALIYQDLYRKHHQIVHADVEVAKLINAETRKEIRSWISNLYPNRSVEMHVEVNPELIGGLRIELESKQMDASIAGELAVIKKKIYRNRNLTY